MRSVSVLMRIACLLAVSAVAWLAVRQFLLFIHPLNSISYSIQSTYNFGEVEPGSVIKHTFVLKNNGKLPLHILQIKAPCSCSSATADRVNINSSESANISVVYNTGGFYGEGQKEILVETNLPVNPIIDLKLMGIVKFPLEPWAPTVHFNYKRSDNYKFKELTIVTSGVAKGDLLDLQKENLPDYLHVNVGRDSRDRCFVSLGLDVKRAPSRFDARIHLIDLKNAIPYSIAVSGSLLEGMRSIPETGYLGIVESGICVDRFLTIAPMDPQSTVRIDDLKIALEVPGSVAALRGISQNGRAVILDIMFTPTDQNKVISGLVKISENGNNYLEIPVKGYLK